MASLHNYTQGRVANTPSTLRAVIGQKCTHTPAVSRKLRAPPSLLDLTYIRYEAQSQETSRKNTTVAGKHNHI